VGHVKDRRHRQITAWHRIIAADFQGHVASLG
jgi:hypothetical protein